MLESTLFLVKGFDLLVFFIEGMALFCETNWRILNVCFRCHSKDCDCIFLIAQFWFTSATYQVSHGSSCQYSHSETKWDWYMSPLRTKTALLGTNRTQIRFNFLTRTCFFPWVKCVRLSSSTFNLNVDFYQSHLTFNSTVGEIRGEKTI